MKRIRILLLACLAAASAHAATNGSLVFQMPGEYATVGSSSGFNFGTGPFAIGMWVKPYCRREMCLLSKRDFNRGAGKQNISLYLEHTGFVRADVCGVGGNARSITSRDMVAENAWSHIVFQKTADDEGIWYVNGRESHREPLYEANVVSTEQPAFIGTQYYDGQLCHQFSGELDELQVWNAVVPPLQVRRSMYDGLIGNESGLAGYWRFNGDGGHLLVDMAVNGIGNGTLHTAHWNASGGSPAGNALCGIPFGNYAPNWNFENETKGGLSDRWIVEPTQQMTPGPAPTTTLTICHTEHFLGESCAELKNSSIGNAEIGFVVHGDSPQYSRLLGKRAYITVWAKCGQASGTLELRNRKANGTYHESIAAVTNGSWSKISLDVPALEGYNGNIEFRFTGIGNSAYYLDCVSFEIDDAFNFKQSVVFQNGNYIDNWSFEKEYEVIEGWMPLNNNPSGANDLAENYENAFFGSTCLALCDRSGTNSGVEYVFADAAGYSKHKKRSYHELTERKIIFSAYVYPVAALPVVIGLDPNTYDDADDTVAFYPQLQPDTWQRIQVTGNAGESWDAVRCFVRFGNGTGGTNGVVKLDGAVVEVHEGASAAEQITVTTEYLDGNDGNFQTYTRTGDDDIAELRIASESGAPLVVTAGVRVPNETHRPITDAFGTVNGISNGLYVDAEGVPYGRTEYCFDGLQRVRAKYRKGYAYQDKPTRFEYGGEELNRKKVVTQYDGLKKIIWTDRLGGVVAEEVFDGSASKLTAYILDGMGRTEKVSPPNYHDFNKVAEKDTFITRSVYDQLGRLIKAEVPDMDDTDAPGVAENDVHTRPDYRFKYDKSGNLRFQTDARYIRNTSSGFKGTEYTYDVWDRMLVLSEVEDAVTEWDGLDPDGNNAFGVVKKRVVNHYDDLPDWNAAPWSSVDADWLTVIANSMTWLRGSLAGTAYLGNDADGNPAYGFTFYGYDERGRRIRTVQCLPGHGLPPHIIVDDLAYNGNINTRTIISGDEVAVTFHYAYDDLNRLVDLRLNDRAKPLCMYEYHPDGKTSRVSLYGEDGTSVLQTIDYEYTVNGWLKSINNPADVGRDPGGKAFAEELEYTAGAYGGGGYYSGLVAKTSFTSLGTDQAFDHAYSYTYEYDGMHRLKRADYTEDGGIDALGLPFDVTQMGYDYNDNITSLSRVAPDGQKLYDYTYYAGTNKLKEVYNDYDASYRKYAYDGNGNLVTDDLKGLGAYATGTPGVEYDYRNMAVRYLLTGTSGQAEIRMTYDAAGQRVSKITTVSEQ